MIHKFQDVVKIKTIYLSQKNTLQLLNVFNAKKIQKEIKHYIVKKNLCQLRSKEKSKKPQIKNKKTIRN